MNLEDIFSILQAPAVSRMLWPATSLAAAAYIAKLIHLAFFGPLARIPGPFLNKISNLPLFYHVFSGQYHVYSTKLHAKYGEVVRIGYDHISLSNTTDTRNVLSTHTFRKGRMYEELGNNTYEANTFTTMDPEANKARRRMIGDAFAMHTMRAVEDLVSDAGAGALIRAWDNEIAKQGSVAKVNYFYAFQSLGIDVIGAVAFGKSLDLLRTGNTEMIDWMHNMTSLGALRGLVPWLVSQPWSFKTLKQSRNTIEKLTNESVEARKKVVRETGAPPRIDVLQKVIDAKDPETGQEFTPPQLESELILMLVAGSDTSGNSLTWALMNLMHYPEYYRRVTDEVRSVFPDTSQMISFADAKSKLPYMSAVMYESMRINPSVSGRLTRSVPPKGTTIQGYDLPSGAQICISFAACHRNPHLWENPDVFNPERFLGPDSAERIKDVMNFSIGVRVCPGRNLAILNIYMVLANILRRYDFALSKDSPYGPHRLNRRGIPVEVPSTSHLVTGPTDPKGSCWLNISLAASA